eukprot:TRINITY_DN20262_c0_g1_i1.p1 TRINITY_DN20262_c0_g1~~TRINITY_DN20262_c0_g1_i1.p1  ORF type:complete len:239 (-),score=33.67 TRINITY_DN20262_c0_g1_i1:162-818(-)
MATAPRQLLVLGSSVSTGAGASRPAELGWAAALAASAASHGFSYLNRGVGGTQVVYWNEVLDGIAADPVLDASLRSADVIVFSLALGNEGLANCRREERIRRVEHHYTQGLLRIAEKLRAIAKVGARIVLGGPYPNQDYNGQHLEALERILLAMRSWTCIDHVIDFLQPCVHDGKGCWHATSWVDAGHPNDLGHQQMFQCVDLAKVLGEYYIDIGRDE